MKKYSALLVFLLVLGCDDEPSFIKLKKPKQLYYSNEIFSDTNLDIYGRWNHTMISCGWSGKGDPYFDHLEIASYGMYSISSYTEILEYGKIEIVEQNDTELTIHFIKEGGSVEFFNGATFQIGLDGNKMELWTEVTDGCNLIFKRIN